MQEIYRLRTDVWRTQAQLSEERSNWEDPIDRTATHWGVIYDGHVVAAIRLSIHDRLEDLPSSHIYRERLPSRIAPPVASYNRLVVHPDHRGQGLSRVLDYACIEFAARKGVSALLGATGSVVANQSRIDTMVRRGFEVLGLGNPVNDTPFIAERVPTILAYFFVP